MMRSPAVQFIFIVLAALSAFTLPAAKSGVREVVATLFVPVAAPVRAVGLWASNRVSPDRATDVLSPGKARDVDAVLRQNAELITRVGQLEAQLEDLKQLSAEYSKLATDIRKVVHPAGITGGPVGNRQTLTITTGNLVSVKEHMPVLQPTGLVGQIYAAATGGGTARVLLITDPESRVGARLVRYVAGEDGQLRKYRVNIQPPLVEGAGPNALAIRMLPAREVRSTVHVGDVAELDDAGFPIITKGLRLGIVSKVNVPATDSGHATIELTPTADFAKLREVLVVDR